LIDEYSSYSDSRDSKSKLFDKIAANIIRGLAQRSRMGDDEMEDLVQSVALDFFKARGKAGDLRRALSKFKIEGGPVSLGKYWARLVDLRTRFLIREAQRKHQERTFDTKETDEGDQLDPISQVRAPSRIDEGSIDVAIQIVKSTDH